MKISFLRSITIVLLFAGSVMSFMGICVLVCALVEPGASTNQLYLAYRWSTPAWVGAIFLFLVYFGIARLLATGMPALKSALAEAVHDHIGWLRLTIIPIFFLLVFFINGTRSVRQFPEGWKFVGGAGSTLVTEIQARQMMWQNLRLNSALLLFGVILLLFTSISVRTAMHIFKAD